MDAILLATQKAGLRTALVVIALFRLSKYFIAFGHSSEEVHTGTEQGRGGGHEDVGHNYIGQNYIDHNYIGHNYIGL